MHLRVLVLLLAAVTVSPCDIQMLNVFLTDCVQPMLNILNDFLKDITSPTKKSALCSYFLIDGKACFTDFVTNCKAFPNAENMTKQYGKVADQLKPYCTTPLPSIGETTVDCINEASKRCWEKLNADKSARCESLHGCMETEVAGCNVPDAVQTIMFREFKTACNGIPLNAKYFPAARKGEARVLPTDKPRVRKTTTAHGASVKVVPATAVLSFAILFSFLLTEDTK